MPDPAADSFALSCDHLVDHTLGLDPKQLGFGRHIVKPTAVIDWSESVIAGVA